MQTFEEIAGGALGRLWSAALFLSAGSVRAAEDRVVDAVTYGAARWFDGLADDPAAWLEDLLVRRFLDEDALPGPPTRATPVWDALRLRGSPPAAPPPEVVRERIYAAAAGVPPAPRAAIWLVQFRRRSYAEAAETLGVGRSDLVRMLRFRDAFVAGLFAAGSHTVQPERGVR